MQGVALRIGHRVAPKREVTPNRRQNAHAWSRNDRLYHQNAWLRARLPPEVVRSTRQVAQFTNAPAHEAANRERLHRPILSRGSTAIRVDILSNTGCAWKQKK